MSDEPNDLFPSALSLPPRERARLAHALLASLDEDAEPDASKLWRAEIELRAREVQAGTAELEEWSAVRARLLKP